jgi:hypothetical protein
MSESSFKRIRYPQIIVTAHFHLAKRIGRGSFGEIFKAIMVVSNEVFIGGYWNTKCLSWGFFI